MSVAEIIILIIGIILVIAGYVYSKISDPKKQKAKAPAGYTEYVGICKKHVEKDGKYHELFEIAHDGKMLKYNFPPQNSKDKLREIDSIEKFYISDSDPKDIKTMADFADQKTPADKKKQYVCYALTGIGLLIIVVILIKTAFFDYR